MFSGAPGFLIKTFTILTFISRSKQQSTSSMHVTFAETVVFLWLMRKIYNISLLSILSITMVLVSNSRVTKQVKVNVNLKIYNIESF